MSDGYLSSRWRTGRHVGRTLYEMSGPEPSGSDSLIGVMDTPELAARVVRDHNAALLPRVPQLAGSGWGHTGPCAAGCDCDAAKAAWTP